MAYLLCIKHCSVIQVTFNSLTQDRVQRFVETKILVERRNGGCYHELELLQCILGLDGTVYKEGEKDGRKEILLQRRFRNHRLNGERDLGEVHVSRQEFASNLLNDIFAHRAHAFDLPLVSKPFAAVGSSGGTSAFFAGRKRSQLGHS